MIDEKSIKIFVSCFPDQICPKAKEMKLKVKILSLLSLFLQDVLLAYCHVGEHPMGHLRYH